MSEYINKEELIDKVLGEYDVYYDFEVAGLVEDFPAIDIVFCSECRYKHKRSDNKLECTKFYKYSNGYEQKRINKNDFCSKGKKW